MLLNINSTILLFFVSLIKVLYFASQAFILYYYCKLNDLHPYFNFWTRRLYIDTMHEGHETQDTTSG